MPGNSIVVSSRPCTQIDGIANIAVRCVTEQTPGCRRIGHAVPMRKGQIQVSGGLGITSGIVQYFQG
jgi:hypothetical protein